MFWLICSEQRSIILAEDAMLYIYSWIKLDDNPNIKFRDKFVTLDNGYP